MNAGVSVDPAADIELEVEAAYDLAAPFYDDWHWQALWRASELPFIRCSLQDLTAAPRRLLDVGCGTGWYLERLQGLCDDVAGVDVSAGMLVLARGRLPQAVLRQADAASLPFDDARFDAVLSTRVLAHLAEPRLAFAEMARVLAPRGVAILSNVDASHRYALTRLPAPDGHVVVDTFKHAREDVERGLVEAGFDPVSSVLIEERGGVAAVGRLAQAVDRPVAGWISAWRRAG